ncbi:hypothetical protein HELRODRAFT_166187 [Helobdella robusta]|uniref:Uncharacterized protein n=1 Tax=Helobdella robusta TaxID=6412 RepID=T1EXV8_HELRO|nr:hypothetical protein HELRODRAFT_166187 [Helobdella robusta]ESN90515.1 hypothetical protein HELRODRAFT_166187 [Helobdella robusta]
MENLHNTITLGFNENIHAMSSEETTNNNNNNNNYNNSSSNNFNNDVAKSNSELTLTLKSLDTTLKRHTEALLLSDRRFCTLVNNFSSSSSNSNKNIEFDSTQQQPDSLLRFLGNGTMQQIGGSSSARSNVAYQRHNSMQQHSNRDVDKMERKVNTRQQQAKNGHQLLSRSFTNTSASNVLFMNGDLEDIKEDIVRNKKARLDTITLNPNRYSQAHSDKKNFEIKRGSYDDNQLRRHITGVHKRIRMYRTILSA